MKNELKRFLGENSHLTPSERLDAILAYQRARNGFDWEGLLVGIGFLLATASILTGLLWGVVWGITG